MQPARIHRRVPIGLVVTAGLALAFLAPAGAPGAPAPWDITDTGQPFEDVEFTLTEGTWMSVDVSPDGRSIVFDLLGDIYRIPTSGGDATLVLGGPAMQRVPRFSPDGGRLLYLSDASGADNAWSCNPDGSDARQLTHETVDLIMGATWGPGGATVAAVKSYATFPAMRASEIRWFEFGGGAGRLLVETPKNKRDVEEARFSPDGRFLYYTERLTDPNIYVDGNHINYAVKQRELSTGVTEEVVAGFGSATTAQPSPDGRLLAFVRRVKAKTVLFVYDLKTREQRPVYDELDRDDMTDFVPQGAYFPAFGWFPDSRHVAIWGKGHLLDIDTANGASRPIPFRAQVHHRITQPLRVSRDVAPERFTVRAIRQLAPAPDGSLVFTAIGHLWRKRAPTATPERLGHETGMEFEPAWSADGKQLAWVVWDDEKGSALRIGNAEGGRARTVATSPGVIRQPAFARDGSRLVYRIEDGDKSMGGYRARPGVYWVAASGGDSHFVTKGDDAPQFSPEGKRIYYTAIDYGGSSAVHRLESVTPEGLDRRVHAATPDADTRELRVSPDLRWLAFRDRQQYYVVPFRETGSALTVSAATEAVPVARLTEPGGYALTWSADSATLHWALGPSLYRAPVAGLFAADARPPAPYATAGLEATADVPAGTVAFTHARLITMRGEEVIEHGTLIVTGNKIAALGPDGSVAIPAGAHLVDATGKTLMPGLIDMHGHIDCCYETGVTPQKQPTRYAALAFGVTTNFDPYSTDMPQYESAETTLAGITVGPRWFGSGAVAYGRAQKSDFTYVPITSLEDARRVMARKLAVGGTFVKSYKQPARYQRQELVRAGREAGILVDVEGESHFYNDVTMILDGHTNLEHNLPVANYYDDIVQLLARAHASNTPTLVVTFGELMGENYMYQTTRAWEDPKIRRYVQETVSWYSPLAPLPSAPPYVRGMTSIHAADEIYDIGFRSVARSVRKLDEAGVIINAGSHGEVPGLSEHWEMWLMAEGGMSNYRVLRTATLNGARTLGVDRQLGSLEPGKLADLIVLDANPLEDIHNTNTVRFTMLNGRLYDSLSMNEIGNYKRPRTRFFWELDDYHGIDWNASWAE